MADITEFKEIKLKDLKLSQKDAEDLLARLPQDDVNKIVDHVMKKILNDLELGLQGEISYEASLYFEAIDKLYEEYKVKGCYMCDDSIDPNAEPFSYPEKTKLCMTCMLKVANVLQAFGIDPQSLFPGIRRSKIQPVIYREEVKLITPSGN